MIRSETRRQILRLLVERGVLIEPDALEHVLRQPDPLAYLGHVLDGQGQRSFYLTMSHMPTGTEPSAERGSRHLQQEPHHSRSLVRHQKAGRRSGDAREHEPMIEILCSPAEDSRCSGNVSDFKRYFNSRFEMLSRVLRQRPEFASAVDIEVAKRYEREVAVLGTVGEVRRSKDRYVILQLEDPTGSVGVLLAEPSEHVLPDEVVGVVGKVKSRPGGEPLLLADRIVRPGVPAHAPHPSSRPLSAALISDIHAGSRYFMSEAWGKFVHWLKGDDPLARRVKYMIVVGDLVDGIGVFPSQEKELEIHDIQEQYRALSALLDGIPGHVEVFIIPGNHDAVRLSEPQPPLPREVREILGERFHFLGNPALLALDGVKVLAYHGKGIDDFVGRLGTLGYSQPTEIMAEMLKRRHLCPVYGGKTQIVPLGADHLAIPRVPDIFVTGHIHTSAVAHYHGIMTVSASAWQSQTPYQVIRNIQPDPAKVVVVDLDTLTHEVKVFA